MTRAVLTFHSIDDSGSVLSFPVRAFAGLIDRLVAVRMPILPFDRLMDGAEGVAITFDDGMRSVHRHALPVLRHHAIPAHLFLTTGRVGGEIGWPGQRERFDMLDWDQVLDCARHGIQIESHTVSHPDLRGLSRAAMIDECRGADDEIQRRVGRKPLLLAFPFGRFDDAVVQNLSPLYDACFTTRLGYLMRQGNDLSRMPRLDSYYLQATHWHGRLLSASTRSYVGVRALMRALRGTT